MYTDACPQRLGGFYYFGHELFWDQTISTLEQSKAFITSSSSASHINVHELEGLLVTFDIWAKLWHQCKVIVYTDNTTAYNSLTNLTLRSPANKPLQKLLLLTAENNVIIEACWIKSGDNGLADALSRKNNASIANICPHWQAPLSSLLLQPSF